MALCYEAGTIKIHLMLIDDIKIHVRAGHGGRGAVAFQANMMSKGPTGGSGGNGGSVYALGVADLGALRQFQHIREVEAEDGMMGRGQYRDGNRGTDVTLKLPVGTVIHNLGTGTAEELTLVDEHKLLVRGGLGGRGNFHFRSSRNTTPKEFQPGLPGEEFDFRFELKMIADVGFAGFPNAGKSSMLNALTNASSRVANYPFTTLEPHLGVYEELILADIPGIIEGASGGKGLGTKFLRHIERTRVIFHFVSAESEDVLCDYDVMRNELSTHNPKLGEKEEYVFLSKCDTIPATEVKKKLTLLRKRNKNARASSMLDDVMMIEMRKVLATIQESKYYGK